MAAAPTVHRLAAFTDDPSGGNPAGVVITETRLADDAMQAIAAEVGYSETAFLVATGNRRYDVRYFAPAAEVPFCGHATIAAGVLLGEQRRPAVYRMDTVGGPVRVAVSEEDGVVRAALTSVPPSVEDDPDLVERVLATFGWDRRVLDPDLSPAVAYAGARHVVLPVASRETLASMTYDFEALRVVMVEADLTTIDVVWREAPDRFHARNPFPVGGVVEDPATGAAAAALGAYLRERGYVTPPAAFEVCQGEDMGRPSRLHVIVPVEGGITVAGTAVPIPG